MTGKSTGTSQMVLHYGVECDRAFDRRYHLQARLVSTRNCMFDYGTLPSPWTQDIPTQERG